MKGNLLQSVCVGCEQLGRQPVVVGCQPSIFIRNLLVLLLSPLLVCGKAPATDLISDSASLRGVSQWNMSLLLSREDMAIGK